MKFVDERKKKEVRFCDLEIGDAYIDNGGTICIKTGEAGDKYEGTCIAFVDGHWISEKEIYTETVEKVEAEFVVH
jgi:uncharacterized protein YabE (DUF348 family)